MVLESLVATLIWECGQRFMRSYSVGYCSSNGGTCDMTESGILSRSGEVIVDIDEAYRHHGRKFEVLHLGPDVKQKLEFEGPGDVE